jgi:hypothetical protein
MEQPIPGKYLDLSAKRVLASLATLRPDGTLHT